MLVEKSFRRLCSVPHVRYVKWEKYTFRTCGTKKYCDIYILPTFQLNGKHNKTKKLRQ
jgi:hypothetical protein